ncbi:palmitoyltransferase ZDHHC19 [Varanus komodoensis]|uniref:palmitoyltransferase ZDHHC19 n=1 Tax=Varanus komodoensis TaxID=61221 RepID=UPI001CF772A7|nr:palmitoyltransferase ZDHHC19 [Varanus komodoensis]
MASGREGCPSITSGLFASFNFSSLVGLSCLFFTFPCSWLALHVSWAFPIICSHLFIPTIIFFLLTSFTDTGILHKGIKEELVKQAVTMNDLDQHWCNQCQLYCLPHTFHCSWCDTCVEEFDHHCVWVNNCIGSHNLRFFLLFVTFLSGYDLAVLASCLVYLALNTPQAFSVEKICTVLVTIPASFYLLPALILLSHQISNAWAAHRKCKHQASYSSPPSSRDRHPWAFCKQQGAKYQVGSAVPIEGATAWERATPSAGLRVLWRASPSPAVPAWACRQGQPRRR